MKKNEDSKKLFEYRVKYNAGVGHSAMDSYHYYNAEDASQALSFHNMMMKKHGFKSQTLSVERKNPYANRWEDESEILNK